MPWNESRWVDEEFGTLLKKAQGTIDIEARRALMKEIETIQRDRGSVAIAWWQNVWNVKSPKLQGAPAHPTHYQLWREAWLDPAMATK